MIASRDAKLSGQTVLVTGAGGFIGSHLTEALVRTGARTRAFVHYNSRDTWGQLDQLPPDVLGEVEIVVGDVRDAARVRQAVDSCRVVFHLAALIGIPYSYLATQSYVQTNIEGTLNVLEACRDGVRKSFCTRRPARSMARLNIFPSTKLIRCAPRALTQPASRRPISSR